MSMNFESHTLDRRSFLKGAGVLGAAGLLSACGGSKSNSTPAASGAVQAPNTTGGEPISEYISFEELEPEDRTFCSLLSNLVLGVPLVVIALIAGAL